MWAPLAPGLILAPRCSAVQPRTFAPRIPDCRKERSRRDRLQNHAPAKKSTHTVDTKTTFSGRGMPSDASAKNRSAAAITAGSLEHVEALAGRERNASTKR